MFFYVFMFFSCTSQPKVEEKPIKRVALVIGNQNYVENALDNPINDAKGIARTLESIGFEVQLEVDLTLAELDKALAILKNKIEENNTMVFIYFAGHGNTLSSDSSQEYLMMTDKNKRVLVSLYKFYDFLRESKPRYNIIAIDACRDYKKEYVVKKTLESKTSVPNMARLKPLIPNFRGNFDRSARFIAGNKEKIEVELDNKYSYKMPRSTIVSYATIHQQRASDGKEYDQKHSPYAQALMKYLDDEEIPIEEVFRRVRVALLKKTDGEQSNQEEVNLEKNIWLVPKRANIAFAPPL